MCHCHRGEFCAGRPSLVSMPPPALCRWEKNVLVTNRLVPEGLGQRSLPWCLVSLGSPAGLMAAEGVIQEPGGTPDSAAAPIKGTESRSLEVELGRTAMVPGYLSGTIS